MFESLKKNRKGVVLMLLSALCVCFGQLLWKMSAESGVMPLILGFALYGVGALLMIVSYRYGKLSVLQPILSINYALSLILGFIFFNEPVLIQKCIGVLIVMIGIFLIVGGDDS